MVDINKVKQELTKNKEKVEQIKQTLIDAINSCEYSTILALNNKNVNNNSPKD